MHQTSPVSRSSTCGAAIGVTLACVLLTGCGSAPAASPQGEKQASTASKLLSDPAGTVGQLMATVRDTLVPPSAPASEAPKAAAKPEPAKPRARRRSAPAQAAAPAEPPVLRARQVRQATLETPQVMAVDAVSTYEPFDDAVYSSADTGVQPPRGQKLALPVRLVADLPPGTSTLELIVSETGAVERARLASRARHLPEMMILSSAKLWTFEPALKDGVPVRYRLLMPLERVRAN